MCDYQGCEFGAAYLDSVCIDGYLWDADSNEGDSNVLTNGGYIPCPKCNHGEWIEIFRDDVADMGYRAAELYFEECVTPTHPFSAEQFALRKYPDDWIKLLIFWQSGFNDYIEENLALPTA